MYPLTSNTIQILKNKWIMANKSIISWSMVSPMIFIIWVILGEFYFRWLKNNAIKIGIAASDPLIFNHLKWNSSKQSPPLSKGQPPIGGAILWERSLFERIKKTIVRFLTYEEMMDCEEGKAVKAHYLRIAKQMKAYEDDLYKNWRAATETNLPNLLRRNLLVKSQKVKIIFWRAVYFHSKRLSTFWFQHTNRSIL